jgi:hypothetical protein
MQNMEKQEIRRIQFRLAAGRMLHAVLRAGVILGFFFIPDSLLYSNFLFLVQAWLWLLVPVYVIGVIGMITMSSESALPDSTRKTVTELHVMYRWWAWSAWLWLADLPFLLFTGILMHDWSLFSVQALVCFFSVSAAACGSEMYIKYCSGSANRHEAEIIAKETMNPVTRTAVESAARKEKESKAVEALADTMIGGGEDEQ